MNHISVFKTVWGKRSNEVMKEELGEPRGRFCVTFQARLRAAFTE